MRPCSAKKTEDCANRRRPIKTRAYCAWHNEAERRTERGWTQERCPGCRRWTRWFTPAESRRRQPPPPSDADVDGALGAAAVDTGG